MATDRLKLYNAALTVCGERHLASLTESREPRRLLDHVWDNDGVDACLERGQWKFAMRSMKLDFDTTLDTNFGYRRAYTIPDDWILTSALCSDEYYDTPLTRYRNEAGIWYADIDEIYVRYVSNDVNYGGNLSLWPATFADYVASAFAAKIVFKLTSDEKKRESVIKWEKRQRTTAKSKDAMAGPQQFPAPGNYVNSRNRGTGSNTWGDRGNRGQLLG